MAKIEPGMGLRIVRPEPQGADTMPFVSDRRLYLNRDKTKVLEHDDPEAAWLLVGEGCELDDATAKQYGLIDTTDKAPAKAHNAAPANKAVSRAPANKAKE